MLSSGAAAAAAVVESASISARMLRTVECRGEGDFIKKHGRVSAAVVTIVCAHPPPRQWLIEGNNYEYIKRQKIQSNFMFLLFFFSTLSSLFPIGFQKHKRLNSYRNPMTRKVWSATKEWRVIWRTTNYNKSPAGMFLETRSNLMKTFSGESGAFATPFWRSGECVTLDRDYSEPGIYHIQRAQSEFLSARSISFLCLYIYTTDRC